MHCRRTLALIASFVLVGGCAPSSPFWDRSPQVAGVRGPSAPAPRRPRAAEPAPPHAATPRSSSPYASSPYAASPYVSSPAPAEAAPYRSGSAPSSQGRFAPSGPTEEDAQVLERVNRIRRTRGLHDFAWQANLWRAAYDHSMEQQVHGYMGHGSPDPRRERLSQRFQQAGYVGNLYGEVVAWNYRTVDGVVRGWMNSPSHRAILLDRKMTEAAFSRVGNYWTGNFGLPRVQAVTRPGPRSAPPPPAGRWQPGTTWNESTPPPGEWIDVTPRKATGAAAPPWPAPAPQAPLARAPVPQAMTAPSPFYVTSRSSAPAPQAAPPPSGVRRVRQVTGPGSAAAPAPWTPAPYAAPAPAPAPPRPQAPSRGATTYQPPAPPQPQWQPVPEPTPLPAPAPPPARRRGSG